jgi:hypothetical protein
MIGNPLAPSVIPCRTMSSSPAPATWMRARGRRFHSWLRVRAAGDRVGPIAPAKSPRWRVWTWNRRGVTTDQGWAARARPAEVQMTPAFIVQHPVKLRRQVDPVCCRNRAALRKAGPDNDEPCTVEDAALSSYPGGCEMAKPPPPAGQTARPLDAMGRIRVSTSKSYATRKVPSTGRSAPTVAKPAGVTTESSRLLTFIAPFDAASGRLRITRKTSESPCEVAAEWQQPPGCNGNCCETHSSGVQALRTRGRLDSRY